jgi:replication-associated recombination protein RarA
MIGATNENSSFEIISRSVRMKVLTLNPLTEGQLITIGTVAGKGFPS